MKGEGYAFFAWHRLRWADDPEPYTCERHYFCHRIWESGDR